MKNRKRCPKCGSNNIIYAPGTVGPYGAGNQISCGLTNLSAVKVGRYVCCDCGFCEEWVDKADLERLKRKYGEKR